MITDTTMLDCGHNPSDHGPYTTGYGTSQDGKTRCYTCCAAMERESMIATGRAVLYLVPETSTGRYSVTDWPGELRFTCGRHTRGHHNIARTRDDVWFIGPDGKPWHGVNYGDNTQLTHCRRLKA